MASLKVDRVYETLRFRAPKRDENDKRTYSSNSRRLKSFLLFFLAQKFTIKSMPQGGGGRTSCWLRLYTWY